jgi:hypothetical protein
VLVRSACDPNDSCVVEPGKRRSDLTLDDAAADAKRTVA